MGFETEKCQFFFSSNGRGFFCVISLQGFVIAAFNSLVAEAVE